MWTSQEVAQATGGVAKGDWQADGVIIDSRQAAPGALFIALKGERFDGHDYVLQALQKGAAAAIVSHVPKGADEGRLVLVKDTEKALNDLGRAGRLRSRARIIAVTGSVGKTGTKECLRVAFSALGTTYATKGNLNNHLGVPLSLANLPSDAAFGIFELGMNHPGEIGPLSRMVRPDAAIITTIEAVHLEFFGSVDAIADAKAEIFEGMSDKGKAILNLDNAQFSRLKAVAEKVGVHVVSFGAEAKANCHLEEYAVDFPGSRIVASINGTALQYRLKTIGRHWAAASVAVLAAVDAVGEDLAKAAAALAYFEEPQGRGKLKAVPCAGGDCMLLDDSYNASPASMRAAFEKMQELRIAAGGTVRNVAVLGDMLELGADSAALHTGLLPSLLSARVDVVFAAGPLMKHLYDTLPEALRGAWAPDAAHLAPKLQAALRPGDLVLVKGSHGSKMYELVKTLEEERATV